MLEISGRRQVLPLRVEGDGVSPWSTFGVFLGCAAFLCAGIGILLCVHDRGVKLGRQQGYEQGYQEGFGAAREWVEVGVRDWWADAEQDVERTRKEMRGK